MSFWAQYKEADLWEGLEEGKEDSDIERRREIEYREEIVMTTMTERKLASVNQDTNVSFKEELFMEKKEEGEGGCKLLLPLLLRRAQWPSLVDVFELGPWTDLRMKRGIWKESK